MITCNSTVLKNCWKVVLPSLNSRAKVRLSILIAAACEPLSDFVGCKESLEVLVDSSVAAGADAGAPSAFVK